MSGAGCFDAVIIGGGFYGCAIAIYLKKYRGFNSVLLVEQENSLLSRASYTNQARVHNGYHYPRSFTTAYRSRINLPKFVSDWPLVVKKDFTKIYAIARNTSKVTARQFERFCREIGAKLSPAPSKIELMFNPKLIERAYLVEEYAFDTTRLADWARRELEDLGVQISLGSKVLQLKRADNAYFLTMHDSAGAPVHVRANYVFNCTYAGLNQIGGQFPQIHTNLKHELTEMALMKMPPELMDMGVTVMDGPFFSFMPFPARNLHTLSHVRYTPHYQWVDQKGLDPYDKLRSYECDTRVDRMIRDVARYIPLITKAQYVESLFEVKTILVKNEGDDGRPILFEVYPDLPGCYSILGGKIDNIYDVYEKLEHEHFTITK